MADSNRLACQPPPPRPAQTHGTPLSHIGQQHALNGRFFGAIARLTERLSSFEAQTNERIQTLTTNHLGLAQRIQQRFTVLEDTFEEKTQLLQKYIDRFAAFVDPDTGTTADALHRTGQLLNQIDLYRGTTLDTDLALVFQHLDTLKRWTNATASHIVFDADRRLIVGRAFFPKCGGLANLALVAFTRDGDVFGGFVKRRFPRENERAKDPGHFLFSLYSHGRGSAPAMFPLTEQARQEVAVQTFYDDNVAGFLRFGGRGALTLGNNSFTPFAKNLRLSYVGLPDTLLTGASGEARPIVYERLIVFQLQT